VRPGEHQARGAAGAPCTRLQRRQRALAEAIRAGQVQRPEVGEEGLVDLDEAKSGGLDEVGWPDRRLHTARLGARQLRVDAEAHASLGEGGEAKQLRRAHHREVELALHARVRPAKAEARRKKRRKAGRGGGGRARGARADQNTAASALAAPARRSATETRLNNRDGPRELVVHHKPARRRNLRPGAALAATKLGRVAAFFIAARQGQAWMECKRIQSKMAPPQAWTPLRQSGRDILRQQPS